MFAGTMAGNFGNYVYHLISGRWLGPVGYGELESLISLFYWLGIIPGVLSLVIVKFTAQYKGEGKQNKLNSLYSYLIKKSAIGAVIMMGIMILLTPFILSFIHLTNPWSYYLVVAVSGMGLIGVVNGSFLQGLAAFKQMTVMRLIEAGLRPAFLIIFLFWGWGVFGAVFTVFVSSIIGIISGFWLVNKIISIKNDGKELIHRKELFFFAIPVLVYSLSFTSLYTTDVVLVRHFLSAHDAGLYAALATLGKIITFTTTPIISVMFPLITQRKAQEERYHKLFILSLMMVTGLAAAILFVYYFFPSLVMFLLYGKEYLAVSSYLFPMGVFLALYSLANVFANFYLCVNKTKIMIISLLACAGQAILLLFFHNNLTQIINVNIIVVSCLLAAFLVYFLYDQRK